MDPSKAKFKSKIQKSKQKKKKTHIPLRDWRHTRKHWEHHLNTNTTQRRRRKRQ